MVITATSIQTIAWISSLGNFLDRTCAKTKIAYMNAVVGGLPGVGLVVGGKQVQVLGPAAQTGQVQVLVPSVLVHVALSALRPKAG